MSNIVIPPTGKQRLDEWENLDEGELQYHVSQWNDPKRSTVFFEEFTRPLMKDARRVIDLGCGAGAATSYLASKNNNTHFIGIDCSNELIQIATKLSKESVCTNISFQVDDWFNLQELKDVDGVISLQSLSWLPEFENPLRIIFKRIQPKWIALSSLFYDGDISCKIEVEERSRNKKCFYNVYSLPVINRFSESYGYRIKIARPFRIDIDIPEPSDKDVMGTYTVLTTGADNRKVERLQISGPLLMNWQFVRIEKI